ncbi:MAG: hypothetical protein ACI9EQ_001422, partial [Bacteroidia bacterium]
MANFLHFQDVVCQTNIIHNPTFTVYPNAGSIPASPQSYAGQWNYWNDNMPFWQPPSKIWFCQHVGTANLHGNPLQRNG